jgi:hypothetical protein
MFIVNVSVSNKMIIVAKTQAKKKEYQTLDLMFRCPVLLKMSWGAHDVMLCRKM